MPLKGDVTKESIEELLKSEKLPAVIEFTDKNSQKIFSAGIERQVGALLVNMIPDCLSEGRKLSADGGRHQQGQHLWLASSLTTTARTCSAHALRGWWVHG